MRPFFPTLWAFAALLATGLSAQPIFQTNFDGPEGTQPAGFTVPSSNGSTDIALNGSGDFRMTLGSNVLALHDGSVASALRDGEISAALRIGRYSPNLYAGLVARYVNPTKFYHARLIALPAGGWGLQVFRFGNGVVQLGETVSVAYVPPSACRMEFRFIGSEITVQLFDAAIGGNLLGKVQASDDFSREGTIGLRATSSGLAIAYESFAFEPLAAE